RPRRSATRPVPTPSPPTPAAPLPPPPHPPGPPPPPPRRSPATHVGRRGAAVGMSRRHRDRGHARTHHRADPARPTASQRLSVQPESPAAPDAAHIEAPADSEPVQTADSEVGREATSAPPA